MFGTFQAERTDVDIVYGLVDQPQFWNPIKHQVTPSWRAEQSNLTITIIIFTDFLLREGGGEGLQHG